MMFNVEQIKYKKTTSKKKITIKYVNFEHCNFPMEIDDDENNSIEEFEKIVVIKYQWMFMVFIKNVKIG